MYNVIKKLFIYDFIQSVKIYFSSTYSPCQNYTINIILLDIDTFYIILAKEHILPTIPP